MMADKSSDKSKTKTIPDTPTKGTDSSTQLKKNTRTPIRKCRNRLKTCRQKITTKQKCPQKKKREEECSKQQKSKDVKKITTAKQTKVKEEKCSAYFQMDLTEKELRSILKNFPKSFILEMPGAKKNRIMEIQCKFAAYETKKRKILKMVSQEGLKKAEVERTVSNLKKIQEKKSEKSSKRKASQEAVMLEQQENQVSETPVCQKDIKNEDFWKFNGPSSNPAATKFWTRSYKTKNKSPVVQQFSPELQLAPKSFSNNLLLNSCDRSPSSNMLPALESTLCSEETRTLQFSKKRRLIGLCENEMTNHRLPFEQVSSSQLSAQVQFSSNPTPKKMNHFEPLNLQQQEINDQSFSQMCLVVKPSELKKMTSFTDGSKILDKCEEKDLSSEATKPKSDSIESGKCIEESNPSNDIQTQIKQLSVIDHIVVNNGIKMASSLIRIKNEQPEESIKTIKSTNTVEFKNGMIQNSRESDKKNVRNEGFRKISCSMESLKNKNCLNENTISSGIKASPFTIDHSYYSNQNETEKKPTLLQKSKIKESERFLHTAKNVSFVSFQAENICHSDQNNYDRANFDQRNSQALTKLNIPESSPTDPSLQGYYSNTNQLSITNASGKRVSQPHQSMNHVDQVNNTLSAREKLHTRNFYTHKEGGNENGKTANNKKERGNRNNVNFYSKMEEKERVGDQIITGHDIENNWIKETNGYDYKVIKQNAPHLSDVSGNNFASPNDLENSQKMLNTASRIQHANFNAENIGHNKNKNNFQFSTPIYHNVDITQSGYETTFDSSNYSEDTPPMDNYRISNSAFHLNYHILKTYLACGGSPEPFSSPNSSTNIEILNNTQAYGPATSEDSSVAVSDDISCSYTKDSNTTANSISRSVSSQLSSCDSCLETSSSSDEEEDSWSVSSEQSSYDSCLDPSSSSDDEENGKRPSPFNCNTLQMLGSNNDIYEECSTNFLGQESKQVSFRSSMESNLSQNASNNFSDEEPRDADTKRCSENMISHRKAEIEPFMNGSLHCLKQGSNMRENGYEQKETIPTSNSSSQKSVCSSSRIKQEGKRNSKKIYGMSKTEVA